MIRRIEALNFRCLNDVSLHLDSFHVLVGPNASGKTTFLDTVAFLGRLASDGLDAAIEERTENFQDLIWRRSGNRFELAIEIDIPEDRRSRLADSNHDTIRYEVAIGFNEETAEVGILAEKAVLKKKEEILPKPRTLFPMESTPRKTILTPKRKGTRTIVNKVQGGNDNFYSEAYSEPGKGWTVAFKLGPRKSALGNLPEDESKFPATTWLKRLLTEGVQPFILNSLLMRKPSPPGQSRQFKPDGSNLPWVVDELKKTSPERFQNWISHVRTALPDVNNIQTIERPEDRHRYLVLGYDGGFEAPSWVASDGTLRLLALTLPAYLPGFSGVYLIEEPENGIHPRAVETVFQSLSSVYDAQILMATHSPVILSIADADSVLCFAKLPEGATDVVLGREHPALTEWQGETSLGVLFAGGVLG